MKFISLFAGIGGFDLGLEWAGMECVAQVEIDDYCQNVLSKHWPNVPKFKDVRDVGKHNLPAADLIAGGFPCQPHSTAGKRKGAADDRDLWPEYFRIIKECRPRWVVGENVPGIRTTILDAVLSDLEGEAYTVTTFNLPAIGFNAPHRRERLFIVAHTTCQQFNGCGQPRQGRRAEFANGGWWATEPQLGRVAHGVPHRVDRLRGLGNAVVPQVAQFIGEQIMKVEYELTHSTS